MISELLEVALRQRDEAIAEVKRLRELPYWTGSWVQESIHDAVRAERDAARAEAERCRENATTGNDVYRKLVDALGFGWNEPDGEHEVAWVDSEDVEHQAMLLRTEGGRAREALQAAREFVGWLTAMGQPTHEALKTRRSVTLSDIICIARAALRALDAALDGER